MCISDRTISVKKLYGFTSERFARMNAVVQSINNEQQDITELSVCLSRI